MECLKTDFDLRWSKTSAATIFIYCPFSKVAPLHFQFLAGTLYCVVFYFIYLYLICLVSCVLYVASFSRLPSVNYPFGILLRWINLSIDAAQESEILSIIKGIGAPRRSLGNFLFLWMQTIIYGQVPLNK